MFLSTHLSSLPTVKNRILKQLKNLGLEKIEDLLFYFPFRWEDYSLCLPISKLKTGIDLTVRGEIFSIENKKTSIQKKNITEALVKDETGFLKVVWFNQPFLTRNLKKGDLVFLSGKIDYSYQGLQMINPEHEKNKDTLLHTARIVPIYSLTKGLTSRWLRFIVSRAFSCLDQIKDFLPQETLSRQNLISLSQAIENIHFPKDANFLSKAKKRLAFDELFLLQLKNLISRKEKEKNKIKIIKFNQELIQKFVKTLPWPLTKAQRRSAWEILQDLEGSLPVDEAGLSADQAEKKMVPMSRLLQGEVGSGKTIVAIMAGLNTINRGFQVVLMAPTEILAQQHFQEINKFLFPFKIKIGLLTRSSRKVNFQVDDCHSKSNDCHFSFVIPTEASEERASEMEGSLDSSDVVIGVSRDDKNLSKKKFFDLIKKGEIEFLVGTHALIQEGVQFKDLGLAIVDEQHRFGVEQRRLLTDQGRTSNNNSQSTCHFLAMSATPIPRTLTLTFYGDLNISIIDEMPKERKKVMTKNVLSSQRERAYKFIEEQIIQGRQAFVICPLIEESDFLGVKSVKEEYEKLSKKIFPHLKIAFLHGKMKAKEKEKIMQDFRENRINILVSTSVVEVGIDVPNANCMMIEGAERFGLAQLHQFRGRIRRGIHQPYCFLFSEARGEKAQTRLSYLEKIDNGFILAEKDLEQRGPGEIFGLKQSGIFDFKFVETQNLASLQILIKQTKEEGEKILEQSPDLKMFPELKELVKKFSEKIHLE